MATIDINDEKIAIKKITMADISQLKTEGVKITHFGLDTAAMDKDPGILDEAIWRVMELALDPEDLKKIPNDRFWDVWAAVADENFSSAKAEKN